MALCVQLDVEQKLQWDITAEPDTTVTALIADAQAMMETEVGRELESGARSQTFDGGPIALRLKFSPVTSITSVTEDGTALTEDDDFKWKENGRLIRVTTSGHQRRWTSYKPQSIDVAYVGGYLAGTHDRELEHLGSICAEIVARAFRKGADNAALPSGAAGAVQSVSLEGSDSVTYATGGGESFSGGSVAQFIFLTEDERRQLQAFKNHLFGFA